MQQRTVVLQVGNPSDLSEMTVNALRQMNIHLEKVQELTPDVSNRPDPVLILIDQPVTDVLMTVQTLRRKEQEANLTEVPILLAVAEEDLTRLTTASGLGLGISDFIRKPILPLELSARIHALITRNADLQPMKDSILMIREETVKMHQSLGGIFSNLPGLLELFSDGGDRSLVLFLDYIKNNMTPLTEAEERALSQTIKTKFEEAEIEHAELFADKLAQMGYTAAIDEFIHFFSEMDKHPGAILVLYKMAGFWKQLATIEHTALRTLQQMQGRG